MDQEVARGSAACVLAMFLGAVPAAAAQACLASEGPVGLVAVDAGRELTLADGRQARLAFVDVPDGYGEAARARLAVHIGKMVTLVRVAGAPDRWGRIAAAILVTQDNAELDLGEDLMRAGLARMNPEPGDAGGASCFAALTSAEGEARRAGRGLWGDPRHELRQARDTAGLLAVSGTFAVFEGRVLSVGERAARTYINFGRRWSEDTTVTIPKRTWRMMVERGVSADGLRGRRVRVRGIVEDRGGPLVEVASPEQFELIGRDQAR